LRVEHRFARRYVVGFVHPRERSHPLSPWLLGDLGQHPLFEVGLAAFAHAVGAGPQKQIVLVLDCAGWHTSVRLRVPEHFYLLFVPPYSPGLQPAEHLLGSGGRSRSPNDEDPDDGHVTHRPRPGRLRVTRDT
jgi:hypothetical protein